MPNKTFNDVQLFFEFLTVLNDATKRVDVDGNPVDLLTNLDSSGKTNAAVELAKIYSWYNRMVTYDSTNNTFLVQAAALPDGAKNLVNGYYDSTADKFYTDGTKTTEIPGRTDALFLDTTTDELYRYATGTGFELVAGTDTTYQFREGSTDGAFQYKEGAGSWNTIAIHNVATLDSNGKVPSTQLPSYVDDVVEGYLYNDVMYEEAAHTTVIPGETGKIYVDVSTNKSYRWAGATATVKYVEISQSLALGETATTAYRGDRGKTAYDHSQVTSGNPHNVTASDVGLGNVDNTADANKNVATAATLTTARKIDGVSFNGGADIIHYGTCSTTASTATKAVSCTGFNLVTGAWIAVTFTVTNTAAASGLKLDVAGTGAKNIRYRNAVLPDNSVLSADRTYMFVYDGTSYQLIGDLDTTGSFTDINMRQTLITTTDAKLRPLLMSYAQTSNATENVDNLGYRMNTVYVDTSTGDIHAPKFVGNSFEDGSGNKAVMESDILILHCNNNPSVWS